MDKKDINKAVIEANVPELVNEKVWVLFKKEEIKGKQRKVPYQTNNICAKVNDSATWTTFDNVIEAYKQTDLYDGIGFVFCNTNNVIGIDLDNVIDETSNIINADAQKIIETINSYTEISPSGKGIHILAKINHSVQSGKTSTGTIKSIEIYRNNRYFTFTGNVYENYNALNNLPSHITTKYSILDILKNNNEKSMTEESIIKSIILTKKGRALFNGEIYTYNSPSEGDMALTRMISKYTRDKELINKIYCKSNRYNAKWDEIHDSKGRTYGEITVDKTINNYDTLYEKADISSEYDMSVYLTNILKQKVIYFKSKWLIMKDNKWHYDIGNEAFSLIAEEINKATINTINRKALLSKRGIEDIMTLYAKINFLYDMSLDPLVINTINACINLKTGENIDASENYDGRCLNIKYDINAKAPLWDKFILETMSYDRNRVSFLKRVLGYAITGKTNEQCMFFLVGSGKNGKSTFVRVLQEILGNYCRQMPAETLKATKQISIGNDLYYLDGARTIITTELNKNVELDEAKIKQMTGQDKIVCRGLYKEHYEYIPEFKIFYNTNHFPLINTADEGMWRRVVYIPFENYVAECNRDYNLLEKLLAEKSGIFNWIVEGAKEWIENNLQIPDEIKEKAIKIRNGNEEIYNYMAECCKEEENSFTPTEEMYERYKEWMLENNNTYKIKTIAKFSSDLSNMGYKHTRKRISKVMHRGIGGVILK